MCCQGFLQVASDPDPGSAGFISITTLLNDEPTLDPGMQSVASFVRAPNASLQSPLALADQLENVTDTVEALINSAGTWPPAMHYEAQDALSWAYMGKYFAAKLRGAVSFGWYQQRHSASDKQASLGNLTLALEVWYQLVSDALNISTCSAHSMLAVHRATAPLSSCKIAFRCWTWVARAATRTRPMQRKSNGTLTSCPLRFSRYRSLLPSCRGRATPRVNQMLCTLS